MYPTAHSAKENLSVFEPQEHDYKVFRKVRFVLYILALPVLFGPFELKFGI